MFDKDFRKNIKKRKEKEELENKLKRLMFWIWNVCVLNMKEEKWNTLDKSRSSYSPSYSPVVFKHSCLLETYLEFGEEKNNI